MLLYNTELAKRFVSDYKLPIQLIDEKYFFYFLHLYEKDFLSLTKYKKLCSIIEKDFCNSPQKFLEYYYEVRDNIIRTIENNDAFNSFNNMDMSKFNVNKKNISKSNVYKENNIGKIFISIDLRKANYQALKYVDPNIVLNTSSYEDFINIFTNIEYIAESKYTRQVIFGKLNPKRHITVEYYIINQIYDYIVKTYHFDKCISLSNDEIIFEVDGNEVDFYKEKIRKITEDIEKNLGFLTKIELFKLNGIQLSCEKFKRSCYYYKEYITDNKIGTLSCVPVNYYAIVYKLFNSMPLQEEDYHFDYEGLDCRYCESFKLEKI